MALRRGSLVVNSSQGGGSKDTWVLRATSEPTKANAMLSRVADSLYWMSRYLERAEHTARLIDVDLQLRLDQSPEVGSVRWLRLLKASQLRRRKTGGLSRVAHPVLDSTGRIHLRFCPAWPLPGKSSPSARAVQHGNVGATQPAVSASEQHHGERSLAAALPRFFRAVQEGAHLFQGVTDSTMSHGEGWQYIQLRTLCRADRLTGAADRNAFRSDAQPGPGSRERRISGVGRDAQVLRRI